MTVELTQDVSDTVAKSGQPIPRLIWFYFDGTGLTVYSMPRAAKVAHIKTHPEVSLNLDSNGNGGGIIVLGGIAAMDDADGLTLGGEGAFSESRASVSRPPS